MSTKNLIFEKQNKISDTKAENQRRVLGQKFPKQSIVHRSSIVVGAITRKTTLNFRRRWRLRRWFLPSQVPQPLLCMSLPQCAATAPFSSACHNLCAAHRIVARKTRLHLSKYEAEAHVVFPQVWLCVWGWRKPTKLGQWHKMILLP